jgi:pilus assembly protein CpaD
VKPALCEPAPAGRGALRRPALGGLLAAVLLLTGCAAAGPAVPEGPAAKSLRVEGARREHRVHFATDSAVLSPSERQRLLAFLREIGPDRRGVIRVAGHADERHTDAYNLALSARRAESVAAFLSDHGLDGATIEQTAFGERFPAVPESTPAAWRQNRRVEIAAEGYEVVLPDCPRWGDPSRPDFDNRPLANLGCATATNLGLMVADPRDLVRGRALGPADGTREAEAVVRYRQDKVKQLTEDKGLQ